jgi:hypothetical protein
MLKNVSQKKIFTILEQKESSKLLEKIIKAFLWNILHLLNKKLQNRRIIIFEIKTVGCLAQINVHKCA